LGRACEVAPRIVGLGRGALRGRCRGAVGAMRDLCTVAQEVVRGRRRATPWVGMRRAGGV
jgi:hypothetical protein